MTRVSLWSRLLGSIPLGRRRSAARKRHTRLGLEPLERRDLLATVDLGVLAGRRFVNRSVLESDTILFELTRPARVSVAHKQTSLLGTAWNVSLRDSSGEVRESQTLSPDAFFRETGLILEDLPPGEYQVVVSRPEPSIFEESYHLALVADAVPPTDFNLLGPTGYLNSFYLGFLSAVGTRTIRDHIGINSREFQIAQYVDRGDFFLFDIPQRGTVNLTLDGILADPQGGTLTVDLHLYRDSNNDGAVELEEALDLILVCPGESGSIVETLNPGRYILVVGESLDADFAIGGSNYRLRVQYLVADNAGSTFSSARSVGNLGTTVRTFEDYLSPGAGGGDPIDVYSFSTVGEGPFYFDARLEHVLPTSNFDLELIRDANGNGRIDSGEVIASSRQAGNLPESISVQLIVPGTYFVRALFTASEGPYTLSLSSRNADLAGGTVETALGIVPGISGARHFSDTLNSSDVADIFRFDTFTASTIKAHFPDFPPPTGREEEADVDLQLFQLDSNGDINILAQSTRVGRSGESIAYAAPPGTYYVRLLYRDGRPVYRLTINVDSAGDSVAAARPLTPARDDSAREFVGPKDTTDFFSVNLSQAAQLTVLIQNPEAPLNVAIGRDANGNGVLDTAEVLAADTTSGAELRRALNVAPGVYLVKVSVAQSSSGGNYRLRVGRAPVDTAGNTLAEARSIEPLPSSPLEIRDFVGDGSRDFVDDLDDFYRLTVATGGPYLLAANLTLPQAPSTGAVLEELIHDANANQQIDEGEVIAIRVGGNLGGQFVAPAPIVLPLVLPGAYYLRVKRLSGSTSYALSLSAISLDAAGDTLATARDLGTLSPVRFANEFVGASDRVDVYRFSVNFRGELLASLITPAAGLGAEIIHDANNDLVVDAGEILASTFEPMRFNDQLHGVLLPAAGNYFVRVRTNGENANYTINLLHSDQAPFLGSPFQITPTATTTIQAEDFDAGGPSDAYFDSTSGNAGGQYRPQEHVDIRAHGDGGFFVSDTVAGEFLEYTLQVTTTGLYDFEFNVSSSSRDASFHAEIDGTNVTGSLVIPNTLEDQQFASVFRNSVLLVAGPHVLRVRMDTNNSLGQAGNYNFIRITPSVGTFELTPREVRVAPGTRTQLSLAWTVPFKDWHVLKEVDLRLSDANGTVLWVRFDEAANTLRLINPATGKLGPAKRLGSNATLSNHAAQIYLRTSRVQSAGAESATVELVLDIRFKPSLRGRHLVVEAAASNDLGFVQPFKTAGSVTVSNGKAGPRARGRA